MAEDALLDARVTNAFDDRGVVQFVGIEDEARQQLGEGRQRGVVRHEARREHERGFLAVQIGEFGFQFDVVMRGTGNVARAARARARGVDCFMHGGEHAGVLAHAEIIVGAPDRDGALGAARLQFGEGVSPAAPDDIRKHPVTPFAAQFRQCVFERLAIGKRHGHYFPTAPSLKPRRPLQGSRITHASRPIPSELSRLYGQENPLSRLRRVHNGGQRPNVGQVRPKGGLEPIANLVEPEAF